MCSFHWDNSQNFFPRISVHSAPFSDRDKRRDRQSSKPTEGDNTSFRLTQYDNLDEFCEFGRCLTEKTTERSVVSLHTFLLKLDLKQV